MGYKKFEKPRLSFNEQVGFLKKQGLKIEDDDIAYHVLRTVGYYRLSGYFLPFKSSHQSNHYRVFKIGTSFNCIWKLYQFDQELRL